MSLATQTTSSIIKSNNDKKEYNYIILPNQIRGLLISDKEADKSGAAMSVQVGSLEDPQNTQGLAHFLEHMLFLGNKKYPEPDDYRNFITQNSGFSNAFTAQLSTNYYFTCSNEAIEGSLDRFSQFFISPLMTKEYVDKELNAVISEHEKNLQQPQNPFGKFGTGNRATLEKESIHTELLEFYKKYYSANQMGFVIFSNQELPQLQQLAEKYFSDIPNTNISSVEYKELPFDENNLGHFFKIQTIRNKHKIQFQWFVEYLKPLYKNNPAHYISHLLGHEGENSLLSILIQQGYAQELVAGTSDYMNLFSVIDVIIELTQKGFENYKQVCEYVFYYLKILREKGVQNWVFEELQSLRKFQFDFKEKEKPGGAMAYTADNLFQYPVEHLLVHSYLMEEYNPEELKRIILSLGMKNLMIQLQSSEFDENKLDLIEPIYSTKYSKEKISVDLMDMFLNPNPEQTETQKLDLPVKNNFLPKKFDILKNEQENQYPLKLIENNFTEVWYKQDNNFFTPKAQFLVKIFSNDISQKYSFFQVKLYLFLDWVTNIESYLCVKIWLKMFSYSIRELNYLAIVANLLCDVEVQFNGIRLSLQGFNDSMEPYLYEITQRLVEFRPEQQKEHYLNIYEKYKKEYENIFQENSYQLAFLYLNILTTNNAYAFDLKELQKQLEKLTFERFCELMKGWLKSLRTECLYLGNIDSSQVKRMTEKIEQIITSKIPNFTVLPKDQVAKIQSINYLENQIKSYEMLRENPNESNSAIIMHFQHDTDDLRTVVLNQLLVEIISNDYFEQLRTQQQLGYIVHCGTYSSRGVYGILFLIQSNVKSSQYLAIKTNDFLKQYYEKIQEQKEEEIEKFKNSLKLQLLEKDTSIYSEASKQFSEITKHFYRFNLNQQKVEILEKITKADLVEFYEKVFNKDKKILEIHIIAQKHKEEFEQLKKERMEVISGNYKTIENITEFKTTSQLYKDYFGFK